MKRLSAGRPTLCTSSTPQAPAIADVVLERAPFGISLVSARPESYGKYVLANPAYCKISGSSLEELKAGSYHDVAHPDELPHALKRSARAELGVFAMLVDAKDAASQRFYEHYGFTRLPGEGRRLCLPITDALRRLATS